MTLTPGDWQAIWLTIQLCGLTTIILMLLATPLAWWLAKTSSKSRVVIQAIVAMPLVLPPTVLGFYLLILLGPHGVFGSTLMAMGFQHLAFSFYGILIGSVIYSLPFAVQPLTQAFRDMGPTPHEVAASLGAHWLDRFLSITLPLCRGGYIVAATLSFAHTLGEFGVILMLGGSIPGETRVLSILIYDYAESMNYNAAHTLSLGMLLITFIVLAIVYGAQHKLNRSSQCLN